MQVRYAACLLASVSMATGCASYHVVPPANFAAQDPIAPSVLRIAFDQAGDVYPTVPNSFNLRIPSQPKNKNAPFKLREFYQNAQLNYDSSRTSLAAAEYIKGILQGSPGSRLVVLIHGFNNDYADASAQYEALRGAIKLADPLARHIYLQVYWDGLFKGPGTATAPLSYFAKALTYSNLAGMCGLRRIVTALPEGTGVTFVTHSRGAAVALSTGTDPLFDEGIDHCQSGDRPKAARSEDVALIAFAPAVGDGHMRDSNGAPVSAHFDYFNRIFVGFNRNDPATSKTYGGITIGGQFGGDTRLGSNPGYIDLISRASNGHLQYVNFSQKSHSWASYLADRNNSECLLWAGRLISAKPAGCLLIQ